MYKYNINPNTFNIIHDPQFNYNDKTSANYLPPYSNYRFNSIYDGIMVEIQIVNHCNLNCANCNHFSPIAKPWCITVEDFKQQLVLVKDNIPNIKVLILIGGEPTLHPQFMELCKIAREIFPTVEDIQFHTNGTTINLLNQYKDLLKEYKINLCFCSYPGYSEKEKIENFLLENDNASYLNTRIFMQETLVDDNGSENYINNFYNCSHHSIPCLTAKDSKLYVCPFAAHIEHYCKKNNISIPEVEGIDYLNIADIKGDIDKIQDFIFTPKPICSYCKHNAFLTIWHKSYKDSIEYNTTLYDLYFKDYQRYEAIINNGKDYFLNCFDKEKNNAILRVDDCGDMVDRTYKRYGKGKIDIIIPYYNMPQQRIIQLYNTLSSQTIIDDCVIYMISDNSPDEKAVINLFKNTKLNIIFLKTEKRSGPGIARNKGLDNCFNNYIFFLDADDYFTHNTALEELYKQIQQGFKIVHFTVYSDDRSEAQKAGYLVHKDKIQNINLRYPNYFFGEDYFFNTYLILNCQAYEIYNSHNTYVTYGLINNTNNLTQEIIDSNKNCISFSFSFIYYLLALNLDINDSDERDRINECILNLCNRYITDTDKTFTYYNLYSLYLLYPHLFNNDYVPSELIKNFNSIQNIEIIKNRILKQLQEYKNNFLISQAACDMEQLIW